MPVATPKKDKAPAKAAEPIKTPDRIEAANLPTALADRPVIYPDVEVFLCDGRRDGGGELLPGHKDRVTASFMKAVLSWETEAEFAARKDGEEPDKRGKVKWTFGDDPRTEHGEPVLLLTDLEGNRVCCWNNTLNRRFDRDRCLAYAQDKLNRCWADSANGGTVTLKDPDGAELPPLPQLTINGETMVISRTGRCLSLQHRAIALIFAEQIRNGAHKDHWHTLWPEEVSEEAILVVGVSDDPKVARTIDDIMPRSSTDTIETGQTFADSRPEDKHELSKMLAAATEVVWKRTRVGEDEFAGHLTHSAGDAFRDRHRKLTDCVRHVFAENRGRTISLLTGSAGRLAGLMYLFAASRSDGKKYRKPDSAADRSEDDLSFSAKAKMPPDAARLFGKAEAPVWEVAQRFVSRLADNRSPLSAAIAGKLASMAGEGESGASTDERTAVLCLAWNAFSEGKDASKDDLKIEYVGDGPDRRIAEHPNVGGIDLGKDSKVDRPMTKAEEEQAEADKRQAADRKRADDLAAKLAQNQAAPNGIMDKFNRAAKAHPGFTLIMRTPAGTLASWGEHASAIRKALSLPNGVKSPDGVDRLTLTEKDLQAGLPKMLAAGMRVALVEEVGTDHKGGRQLKVADLGTPEANGEPVKAEQPKAEPVKKTTPVVKKPAAKPSPAKAPAKKTPVKGKK